MQDRTLSYEQRKRGMLGEASAVYLVEANEHVEVLAQALRHRCRACGQPGGLHGGEGVSARADDKRGDACELGLAVEVLHGARHLDKVADSCSREGGAAIGSEVDKDAVGGGRVRVSLGLERQG